MTNTLRLSTILACFAAACAGVAPDGGGNGDGNGNGNGNGGGNGGGDGISAAEYMAGLGKAECDGAHMCKSSFPTDAGVTFEEAFGASANACYSMAAEYYDAAAVEASISAGKIDFDGVAAQECVRGITTPACGAFWNEGPSFPAACDDALVGNVANGAACTIDFECADPESICDETTAKCAAAPAGQKRRASSLLVLAL